MLFRCSERQSQGGYLATADRLLAILDLFTLDRPDWSVEQAAKVLKAPPSTLYRYINSLTKSGLLAPLGGGRYILGPSIIRYDRQLRLTDPLVRASRSELDRLARSVAGKGVVFLCRLFGDQVMCVSQAFIGDLPFNISYERGRLMPLFAGSASRVILANLSDTRIKALFKRYADDFRRLNLGATPLEVRATLKKVKSEGCYVTVGEVDPGMRGMSVPIFWDRKIIGSLTIAGPRQGFSPGQTARSLEGLREAARDISTELLHRLAQN
jgi:DNA-binding IclR family transcriptional regulator